jgi:hypothetical protein
MVKFVSFASIALYQKLSFYKKNYPTPNLCSVLGGIMLKEQKHNTIRVWGGDRIGLNS